MAGQIWHPGLRSPKSGLYIWVAKVKPKIYFLLLLFSPLIKYFFQLLCHDKTRTNTSNSKAQCIFNVDFSYPQVPTHSSFMGQVTCTELNTVGQKDFVMQRFFNDAPDQNLASTRTVKRGSSQDKKVKWISLF